MAIRIKPADVPSITNALAKKPVPSTKRATQSSIQPLRVQLMPEGVPALFVPYYTYTTNQAGADACELCPRANHVRVPGEEFTRFYCGATNSVRRECYGGVFVRVTVDADSDEPPTLPEGVLP